MVYNTRKKLVVILGMVYSCFANLKGSEKAYEPSNTWGVTLGVGVDVPFWGFVSHHLQISVGNYIPNGWVMFNWDIYQPGYVGVSSSIAMNNQSIWASPAPSRSSRRVVLSASSFALASNLSPRSMAWDAKAGNDGWIWGVLQPTNQAWDFILWKICTLTFSKWIDAILDW